MKVKSLLRIPMIVQSLAEIILLLSAAALLFLLILDWNREGKSCHGNVLETEISLEIYRILNDADRTVTESKQQDGSDVRLDYLTIREISSGRELIKKSTADKGDSDFIQENFSTNTVYPFLDCSGKCYIFNRMTGIYKTGIPVEISYAAPFEQVARKLENVHHPGQFFIIDNPGIKGGMLKNDSTVSDETAVYSGGGTTFSDTFDLKNDPDRVKPGIREILRRISGSSEDRYVYLKADKFIPSDDIFFAVSSGKGKNLLQFAAAEKYRLLLLLASAAGFAILFFRRISAVNDCVNIIRRHIQFNPSFMMRDEINYIKLKLAELVKTSNQQKDTIRRLRELLLSYSDHDPGTGLPLKELFCQNVTSRILIHNPGSCSALALLNINLQIAESADSEKPLQEELLASIKNFLNERDCLGTDADISYSLFIHDRKNLSEITDILQNIMDLLTSRYFSNSIHGRRTVSCGVCELKSSSDTSTDLYFNADLALVDAMGSHSAKPVFFNDSMKGRLTNSNVADMEFEKDLEDGKIYTVFRPVLKTDLETYTSMLCNPKWRVSDTDTVTGYEFYRRLKHRGSHRRVLCMLLENSFSMLRKLDTAGKDQYNAVIIILTQQQINDPKFFEFLETMTLKYTLMNSRIVFALDKQYLLTSEYDTGKTVLKLREMDFNLTLVCQDNTLHAQELMRKYSFEYLAISSDLALEIIQDPVKLDEYRRLQHAVESTGRKTCVYNVKTKGIAESIMLQLNPMHISGEGLSPDENDDSPDVYEPYNK